MHICNVQVTTQEAIRCPAFLLWEAATARAPPIRLKRLFFFFYLPTPKCREMGRNKVLEVRWEDTQGERERETETETKSKRVSCGLNSDQLFKVCACSWVWAALIKDAVSEQATDAREGGTPRLTRKGWGWSSIIFQDHNKATKSCWIITTELQSTTDFLLFLLLI